MISARTPAEALSGPELLDRIRNMLEFYGSTFVNQDDERVIGFLNRLRTYQALLQQHSAILDKIPQLELRTIRRAVDKPLTLSSFSPKASRETKKSNKSATLKAIPTAKAGQSDTSKSAYIEKSELADLNPKGIVDDLDKTLGMKNKMMQDCLAEITGLKMLIKEYETINARLYSVFEVYKEKNAKLSTVCELYVEKIAKLSTLCDLRNEELVQLKKLYAYSQACLAKAMENDTRSDEVYHSKVENFNNLNATHEALLEIYNKSIELSAGLREMLDLTTEDNEKNKVEIEQLRKGQSNLIFQRDEIYYILDAIVKRAKSKSFKMIKEEIDFIIKMLHIQMSFLDIGLPLAAELHNVTGWLIPMKEKSALRNCFDFSAYKHQCIRIITKALPSIDKEIYSHIYNLALEVLGLHGRSMRTDFKFFSPTMNLTMEQARNEVAVLSRLQ